MKTLPHIPAIVFSLVWFINGMVCKILNVVPRHQEIVASIMGDTYAGS